MKNSILDNESILYSLSGSKDIVVTKENAVNNLILFKVPKKYSGMMKLYFPVSNTSVNFISENKNVSIELVYKDNKVVDVIYLDESNMLMNSIQDVSQKKELILPALIQIKEFYKTPSIFGSALDDEIKVLSTSSNILGSEHPFIDYYYKNYNRFLLTTKQKSVSQEDIISFFSSSNEFLESSSLIRPLLVQFLSSADKTVLESKIDEMLTSLVVESPRGQVILSELIDIFDAYDMKEYKEKYLSLAKNLKCTITERLQKTLVANKNIALGSTFPNYTFKSAINTKSKSIYDVKAEKKLVVFWSSTCSHCETELPQLLSVYQKLRERSIEVVALSLDSDKESYLAKVKAFPWINDSELKGWSSSFANVYNLVATPTYFILDSNNVIISKPSHMSDVLAYFNVK